MCFIASKQRQYSFNQTYYNKTLTNRKSTTPRVLRSACMRLICHVLRQKTDDVNRSSLSFLSTLKVSFMLPSYAIWPIIKHRHFPHANGAYPFCAWLEGNRCGCLYRSIQVNISRKLSSLVCVAPTECDMVCLLNMNIFGALAKCRQYTWHHICSHMWISSNGYYSVDCRRRFAVVRRNTRNINEKRGGWSADCLAELA